MCSSPSSKKILVSLDTSDTINLNCLDVLPMQLNFGSLDKSIVNVDIDKQGMILNQYEGTENDDDEDEDEHPPGNNKGKLRRVGQRSRSNGLFDQYHDGDKKFKKKLNKRIAKSTSHHHHQHQKQPQQQPLKPSQSQLPGAAQSQSQHNNNKLKDSKAVASSSFDRYGRLTRVTTNYADDYRTAKLSRKMSQIRRRKALHHLEKLSNTSREHLARLRGHRNKTQKTSVAAKNLQAGNGNGNLELDDSEDIDDIDDDEKHAGDKFSKEIVRQIRELGLEDGMKTSVAFAKLTQALKDLQSSWEEDLLAAKTAESLKFNDDERKLEFSANTITYSSPQTTSTLNNNNNDSLNTNEISRKQEDLLTLCPTKNDPFVCHSSHCSVFYPDNNNNNVNSNPKTTCHINASFTSRNPVTHSDAIIFSKETPGDYFRSPTPTPSEIMDLMEATKQQQQSTNHHSSMPELTEQKQVDIWNWVSSKCSGCQGRGRGLSIINQMCGDQDPSSMMNFHDDDQTFSLCSLKDQDGSFTDGEGDEFSPIKKLRPRLMPEQEQNQILLKNHDHPHEHLNEFIHEFLNNNDRTKLMGAALEKNKIILVDNKNTQGQEKLSCVALEEFDKQQKQQQLARQSSCCSLNSSNSKSKRSESCPSVDMDGHTDVDNDENGNEIPPPPTSTWNLSPLYEDTVNTSSECISTDDTPKTLNNNNNNRNNNPNESECSITPVVYSLASLGDLFSGDEIATRCSTASTVTSYDNLESSKEQAEGNDRMYMDELSEQRLLQLLGQYNKTEEHKKKLEIMDKLMENIAATPLPSAKTVDETSDKDVKQDKNEDDANEEENKTTHKTSNPKNIEEKPSVFEKKEHGRKFHNTEIELRKSSMNLLKKISSSEIKKSKKKKPKKSKRKDKDDGESSGGEDKENKVKMKKPKAITLFKCDSSKIPGNGTATGEDGELQGHAGYNSRMQKLKNSLPRTPGGRFAFSSIEAEVAIAEYVKAELAASLDLGSEAKLKPGKLRDILCSVSKAGVDKHLSSACQTCEVQTTKLPTKADKDKEQKDKDKDKDKEPKDKDKEKKCKEKTNASGAHHHHPNHNTNKSSNNSKSLIPVKKKNVSPITKKSSLKPPVPLQQPPPPPSLPQRPLNYSIIPKQSNRINFIRYQQQSIAAMLNISRNRLRNQKPGYHRPLDRTGNPGFPRLQNPRESLEFAKKRETLNAKLRSTNNRNNVTVVFGNSHNLNNVPHNSIINNNNSSS